MSERLTKKDVAKRQIRTAIRLLFESADEVSIYSLASNGWEIIDTLCTNAAIESISNDTREHADRDKDLKRDYVNPYRNFFKHADRDPQAVLDCFDQLANDSVIFLAVEDYIRLYQRSPIEFQVFQLWYLAVNREKAKDDDLERLKHGFDHYFPGILNLSRAQQLEMGCKVLDEALRDESLRNDEKTEL